MASDRILFLFNSGTVCWLVEKWQCYQWWCRFKTLYFFTDSCTVMYTLMIYLRYEFEANFVRGTKY